MAVIRCCYQCEIRHVGCHSSCKEYIKAKLERDKVLESKKQSEIYPLPHKYSRHKNILTTHLK